MVVETDLRQGDGGDGDKTIMFNFVNCITVLCNYVIMDLSYSQNLVIVNKDQYETSLIFGN